jgi:hypothetical protein
MRAIFIILIISAFTGFQKLSGQQIIAGQIEGPDIVYTNPDDIQLYCDNVNTSHFYSMDIDQDGLNDLMFNASYFYYSHLELRGTNTAINSSNHVQISKVDSLQYSTYQHQGGDTINNGLSWISSNLATLNSYSSDGSTENFKGEGYIGFRICLADTIYGWIHAMATGNTETAKVIIYDFAYVSKSNHMDKQKDKPVISCSNPVHDELIIRIPEGNNTMEWKCSVYDIMARNLLNKELSEGENHINISSFDNGTYFVIIRKKNGSQNIFKIIKN